MKQPCVYMMANKKNGTLYIGVTSDPIQRGWQHRESMVDGFTKRYDCNLLVWFEQHSTMESAIQREKRLKKYTREQKIRLIEVNNSQWRDLYMEIV